MTTLADTCNRANSTTTPNPASDGGNYTVDFATAGILSNRLYFPAVGTPSGPDVARLANKVRRDLGANGCDFTVDWVAVDGVHNQGMWIAYDPSTGSGYAIDWDGGAARLSVNRVSGGGLTAIGATFNVAAIGTGTTIRVVHNGAGQFTVYQGGTQVDSPVTDPSSTLTGTWVGVYVDHRGGSGAELWDNFTASSIVVPPPVRRARVVLRQAVTRAAVR